MAKSPAWQRKEGKNPKGGLNAKGRASAKAEGHNLKPPAPHPKTEKDANRRKSFCARMSGMPGPMKDDNGKPTRKALSLRAWNCADGGAIRPELGGGGDALKAAMKLAQEITSAKTSVNQIPGLFKSQLFEALPNHRNLDIGGGKYDTGTEFLKSRGITSQVYDPFNRPAEHNESVMSQFKENPADSVTVANVLNVIREPEARASVIQQALDALRPGGKAYFSVYEGNRSGAGAETPKGWQENRKALEYLDEIKKHFPEAQRKGDIIYGSRPEMGAGGDAVKAAMKIAQDALLALHGMKSHRLDMTEKLKGLPVPSIAITKPEQGYNRFGDITLVGGKEMATPSRLNPVYGADVYSPRFPSLNDEGDKIFKGFTSLGNRRYSPLTMQNVVKEMAGNIRGGEGFNYGAGNIRAAVTPQFKTLKDVQNARESIVSSEEFKPHKKAAEDYLFELADKFHPYSLYSGSPFQHTQSFAETLSDVGKGRHSAWSQDYKDIPDELKQEAMDYLSRLKTMPTEYFEAKPQRAVSLGEFSGAVVPENLMRETVPRLKNLGIKEIVPFNPDTETGQIEALREFSNLHFNQGGEVRPEMGGGGKALSAAVKMAQDIIKAYHGSPHKFDKFDINKIGTGEGAQAYGHGLYFADNENVAKSYRDALSPGVTLAADNRRLIDMPEHERQVYNYLYRTGKLPKDAIAHFEKESAAENEMMKILGFEDTGPSTYNKYVDFAKSLKDRPFFANKGIGHMYEVGINANPEHLLDWDKPLNEQSDAVRQYLRNLDVKPSSGFSIKDMIDTVDAAKSDQRLSHLVSPRGSPVNPQGSSIYEMLANTRGATDWPISAGADIRQMYRQKGASGASDMLKEAGIPGIKYLDQGSRGAGEGSSNYVVFDPNVIDIMRRYADGGRIPFDDGGIARIEELLRQAKGEEAAKEASHPVGMSANVEFAPVEIDEPITGKKIPLGSLPAPTAAVANPIANILAQYGPYAMGPIPAGMAAARDLATGLKEGSGLDVATAAMGAPGKLAKYGLPALGAVTDLLSPTEAQAGPYSKFLRELAEKYRPHYDPSAMVKGQPKDKWISDVALSRPIEDMSVTTTGQRQMIPEKRIKPASMAGKAMISGFGDKTPAGYVVTHINDKPLSMPVDVLGGPAFARDKAAQVDKAYWGSNRSRAAALANKGKEAVANEFEPIFAYVAQGPQSQDYSHQMTDMILGQLEPGKMEKSKVENFDRLMREVETKRGMPGIPTWPGLKSSELRDWLMNATEGGAGRAKMAKLMDKSMYLKAPGFADVGAARYATTHPDIMNTPIFSSGHMFSRMDPEGRLITKPKVPHPSYDTLLASPKGKKGYIGGFEYTLPPELHYHDYLSGNPSGYQSGLRQDLVERPFSQKTMSLMRDIPTVIGTPKWVDMASEYQDIMRYLYGRRP
jgi:SAM-dependent methyltransferase